MTGTIEKQETPRLLTVEEAAERLRVSRPTMYRLANAEVVPALRVGGSIRFDAAELEEWLYSDPDDVGGGSGAPVRNPAVESSPPLVPPSGSSEVRGGDGVADSSSGRSPSAHSEAL